MPGYNYYCVDVPLCQAFDGGSGIIECQLDAVCNPADGGNPCATDGLTCDQTFSVCRNPSLFDTCTLGGPSCTNFGDTTSPMVCSPPIFGVTGDSVCTFSCVSTADCVEPYMSCITQNVGTGPADVCEFSTVATQTNCPTTAAGIFGGVCDATSAGSGDGVCIAVGGDTVGLCMQSTTDGDGGVGAPCNINGNRQIGGLCDTQDICSGNLCSEVCNAGTNGGTRGGCGAGLDCLPLLTAGGIGLGPAPTVDADTAGACVTPCDFTDTVDGGTCGLSAQGVPTRCIPAEEVGYTLGEGPDFCAASAGALALPIGADCSKAVIGNALDVCVDGAICVGRPAICSQLCEDKQIGKVGAAGGCPVGDTCTGLDFTGTASTHTGACLTTPDAG